MINLTNISKRYQVGSVATPILNQISLNIAQGEMLAIVGMSGSGKSTLMNIIGLLDKADQGQYHFKHHDIASFHEDYLARLRNQSFGFIFQQFNLLPRFNALKNVALPLLYRKIPLATALIQAEKTINQIGLSEFQHHYPPQLSGGQQQRIAIARALVGEPDVILADEPTGALDSMTGQEIMQLFLTLNQAGRTVIIITHDEQLATQCSRQIKLIDGKIQ